MYLSWIIFEFFPPKTNVMRNQMERERAAKGEEEGPTARESQPEFALVIQADCLKRKDEGEDRIVKRRKMDPLAVCHQLYSSGKDESRLPTPPIPEDRLYGERETL